jgi:hypothetical protein
MAPLALLKWIQSFSEKCSAQIFPSKLRGVRPSPWISLAPELTLAACSPQWQRRLSSLCLDGDASLGRR